MSYAIILRNLLLPDMVDYINDIIYDEFIFYRNIISDISFSIEEYSLDSFNIITLLKIIPISYLKNVELSGYSNLQSQITFLVQNIYDSICEYDEQYYYSKLDDYKFLKTFIFT